MGIRQVADFIQLRNGSVHAERSVCYNNPAPATRTFLEFCLQVLPYYYVRNGKRWALHKRTPSNNRSMVKRIADNSVLLIKKRFKYTAIGIKSSGIQNGIFRAQETGYFLFQLFVYILCATDKAHTAHAISMRVNSFVRSFNYFGMGRKSQVIVGTKIQARFSRSLQSPAPAHW